ncbi:MAG: flavodoxin family protein [Solobacterium sp.]|nr:flavodoxin family protein [Solobacterium sp.]
MKKIVVVNAGPRKNWNTDLMLKEAARGAEEAGAQIQFFDLYRLERFTGCVSCFACKLAPNHGKCMTRDGLTPVLDAIREADGLIIGSPNYLGEPTAVFRSLYERLIFQNLTYEKERRTYVNYDCPVLMIMTSNISTDRYAEVGYTAMLETLRQRFSTFVGPAEVLTAGNTMQVDDYSRYTWTGFDPEQKKLSRKEQFPKDLEKAFLAGKALVSEH